MPKLSFFSFLLDSKATPRCSWWEMDEMAIVLELEGDRIKGEPRNPLGERILGLDLELEN